MHANLISKRSLSLELCLLHTLELCRVHGERCTKPPCLKVRAISRLDVHCGRGALCFAFKAVEPRRLILQFLVPFGLPLLLHKSLLGLQCSRGLLHCAVSLAQVGHVRRVQRTQRRSLAT